MAGGKANDSASSSFIASYQKAKGSTVSTIPEVEKMRQELKEREQRLINDLNRFKTQTTYTRAARAQSKVTHQTYEQSNIDVSPEKQEQTVAAASSFIIASPKIITIDGLADSPTTPIAPFPVFQESKQYQEYKSYLARNQEDSPILQGSFTQIYDFPSESMQSDNISEDNNIAPGSSKIDSPTKVFHTSERTSPIKDDENDKELTLKKASRKKRSKVSKPRRRPTKRKQSIKRRAKPRSPPSSPLSDFAIDPQFLQKFKGIWCKTLPRPLLVPNPSSPDCFI